MSFRPAFDTVGNIQSIRKCVSWRVCVCMCVSVSHQIKVQPHCPSNSDVNLTTIHYLFNAIPITRSLSLSNAMRRAFATIWYSVINIQIVETAAKGTGREWEGVAFRNVIALNSFEMHALCILWRFGCYDFVAEPLLIPPLPLFSTCTQMIK